MNKLGQTDALIKHYRTHLETLRKQAAESELISSLATDPQKRELFAKHAAHLNMLAGEVERAMAAAQRQPALKMLALQPNGRAVQNILDLLHLGLRTPTGHYEARECGRGFDTGLHELATNGLSKARPTGTHRVARRATAIAPRRPGGKSFARSSPASRAPRHTRLAKPKADVSRSGADVPG